MPTTATTQPNSFCFWLAGLLILTVLVYLPGLAGPFLFDDMPSLIAPVSTWLNVETGWQEVVLGNNSGLLGRPVAMLSFIANAAMTGLQPLPFKATNLAIHLLCGVLIYALLSRLLTRDPLLRARANLAALAISALWLLHPMQVSTVLYIVQRMAQLSTLFTLVALLAYVISRMAFEADRKQAALAWLFLAVPAATVAAVLSKENGALVPLLCAVIELGYFRASASAPRPRAVKWFFVWFLLLPSVLVLYRYGLHPHRLLDDYQGRLFMLGERLLSEPRALMDYMGALLLPRGPMLGVYTDDFAISHGLLDPPGTLFAILGLIALVMAAFAARMRNPAFFTGIGLYLAGHAMESTIFPLELYFEHRNYLPSMGFFLALAGLAGWVFARLSQSDRGARARRLLSIGGAATMAMLSVATLARASVWRSMPQIAEQGAREHPQSMRAQVDYVNTLQTQGRYAEMQNVFDHMMTMSNPTARHAGIIDSVGLQCMLHGAIDDESVARMTTIAGAKLELAEMQAFESLGNFLQNHNCERLTRTRLATLIGHIVDTAPQPAALTQLWRSRFVAARLYAADGQPVKAQEQAALAWKTGAADTAVGVYLANLYYLNDDFARARLILADAQKHTTSWDVRNQKLAEELHRKLDAAPR